MNDNGETSSEEIAMFKATSKLANELFSMMMANAIAQAFVRENINLDFVFGTCSQSVSKR